jgi:hypothetical protein
MDEVTPPAEVTVERVDGVVNGGLVEALELALREVNSPEFAEVVLARLEAVGMWTLEELLLSVSELELKAVPTVKKTDEVSKTVLITSVEDVKVVLVPIMGQPTQIMRRWAFFSYLQQWKSLSNWNKSPRKRKSLPSLYRWTKECYARVCRK